MLTQVLKKAESTMLEQKKQELENIIPIFKLTFDYEVKETRNEKAIIQGMKIWKEIKACQRPTATTIERLEKTAEKALAYSCYYN